VRRNVAGAVERGAARAEDDDVAAAARRREGARVWRGHPAHRGLRLAPPRPPVRPAWRQRHRLRLALLGGEPARSLGGEAGGAGGIRRGSPAPLQAVCGGERRRRRSGGSSGGEGAGAGRFGGGRGVRRRALPAGGEAASFGGGAREEFVAAVGVRTLAGDWLRRALRGVEVGAGVEAADPYNVDRRIALSLAR